MKILLGIDIGTTGVRCTLLDESGKLRAQQRQGYSVENVVSDGSGLAAQADVSIFQAALRHGIAGILGRTASDPLDIGAIAISAMAPDVIPVDAECRPLHPCVLWLDRRASEEAELVRRRIGEERVFSVSGNPIDPYYGLVKMLWFKRQAPDVFRKTARFLSLKDFLVAQLTGTQVTDFSHAGVTGIAFDIRRNRWNPEILGELGLAPGLLPEPRPSDVIVGHVTRRAAGELGLAEGIPVANGMIDSAAGYLACGTVESNQSAMTLGTSSCWGICTDQDVFPRGMNITRAPWNEALYLINASLAAGGATLAWLLELFDPAGGETLWAQLEHAAAAIPVGSEGLYTLPHLLGERAPLWDPHARGVLFGLHPRHKREHFYRSALEGIAFCFYRNKLLLDQSALRLHPRIVATGGSARSPLLRRVLADALNLSVDYAGNSTGGDVAAAWLAGKAAGVFQDYSGLRRGLRIVDSATPSSPNHRLYTRLYDSVYKHLYPRLRDLYPALAMG